MLSDQAIRESWEAERDSMREWLLTEKKFNPKSVDKFINNFIESAVFANIVCPSRPGVVAAFRRYASEQEHCKITKRQFLSGR